MVEAVLFVDDAWICAKQCRMCSENSVCTRCYSGSLQDVEHRRDEALTCELALVDINLGRGEPTGVNVFEWLAHQGFAGRVVFLTGHAGQDPRVQHAATLSGSSVASKPLSVAELRALIGAASPPP